MRTRVSYISVSRPISVNEDLNLLIKQPQQKSTSRGIQISGSALSSGRKILGTLTRLTAVTRDEKESDVGVRGKREGRDGEGHVLRLPRCPRGNTEVLYASGGEKWNLHFYLRTIKRTVTEDETACYRRIMRFADSFNRPCRKKGCRG